MYFFKNRPMGYDTLELYTLLQKKTSVTLEFRGQ